MLWFNEHILTVVVFLPLAFAGLGLLLKGSWSKYLATLGTLVTFVVSLHLWYHDSGVSGFRFSETMNWIPSLGIQYKLGVDGFSLWLILLTTILSFLSVVFSTGSIQQREKEYYFFMLVLECGMLGALVALDVFLFYIFWEAMLIPMYFLIGIWGGKEKIYAAIKFFIFTLVGSVLMLVAILYLYFKAGQTFELSLWYNLELNLTEQLWLFAAFALSFAIKVPMVPLHTWLPDAHVQAPTAGSVILAGILLKMGTYGFVRFAMPLFPEALLKSQSLLAGLAVIGIVYGALVAMVQKDIKKLVAYSSVSHLGFVMLGLMSLSPHAINGAVYQMLNHGISTGALFLLVGMIYDRTHTREIKDYGGIAKQVPIFTVIFMIVTFSSIALPGTNGFIGEFLILSGSYASLPWLTIVASTGVVLSAVYMLWMVERVFFGEMRNPKLATLTDLKWKEIFVMAPLVVLIFWMGVQPKFFLDKVDVASQSLILQMKTYRGVQVSK